MKEVAALTLHGNLHQATAARSPRMREDATPLRLQFQHDNEDSESDDGNIEEPEAEPETTWCQWQIGRNIKIVAGVVIFLLIALTLLVIFVHHNVSGNDVHFNRGDGRSVFKSDVITIRPIHRHRDPFYQNFYPIFIAERGPARDDQPEVTSDSSAIPHDDQLSVAMPNSTSSIKPDVMAGTGSGSPLDAKIH